MMLWYLTKLVRQEELVSGQFVELGYPGFLSAEVSNPLLHDVVVFDQVSEAGGIILCTGGCLAGFFPLLSLPSLLSLLGRFLSFLSLLGGFLSFLSLLGGFLCPSSCFPLSSSCFYPSSLLSFHHPSSSLIFVLGALSQIWDPSYVWAQHSLL